MKPSTLQLQDGAPIFHPCCAIQRAETVAVSEGPPTFTLRHLHFVVQEAKNRMVSKLHEILKPFLLRRVKADVEKSLPSKQEIVLYAPLTKAQRDIQENIVSKTLVAQMVDKAKSNNMAGVLLRSLKERLRLLNYQENQGC
jgi:SNF2 family DNA or RNA helicase